MKAVIIAANKAMHITAFFLTKPKTFSINTPFLNKSNYIKIYVLGQAVFKKIRG